MKEEDLYLLEATPATLAEVYDIIFAMPKEEKQSNPQVKVIAEYAADLLTLINTP